MAETILLSPGIIEREKDSSASPDSAPTGIPAGVIGTSKKGPAFVPVTVESESKFKQVFGSPDPKTPAGYGALEFLKNKPALTYMRVLGAGSVSTTTDISAYQTKGQVKGAGFVVTGSAKAADGRHEGAVQFILAAHTLATNEAYGMPMFTQNDSVVGSSVNLVRGEILVASGTRIMVLNGNEAATSFSGLTDDLATLSSGKFKLVISSSAGAAFSTADGNPGLAIYTASLDPSSQDYFGKLLNTDPEKFDQYKHVLYADYAVDAEVASATSVAVASGSSGTSTASGDTSMTFRDAFGHFDTRYTSPASPWILSQPFGTTEYKLFRFESLDDGAYANSLYKISIRDLKMSNDPSNPYGTFTVLVRDWNDTDQSPKVLEQFSNCSLNPLAQNYIARVIGDRKVSFNFDADVPSERRFVTSGKYNNVSSLVRVVVSNEVEKRICPKSSLPFGFEGIHVLKTNDNLADTPTSSPRLALSGSTLALTSSILPPVPFRFKVTRGDVLTSGFSGNPSSVSTVSSNYYWGVKFERNTDVLDTNSVTEKNRLVEAYSKFSGIEKLDTLVTGSGANTLNNNKFSLSKVAFFNTSVSDLTSSIEAHMKEAAYIRDANPDPTTYTVNDGVISTRITLATLAAQTSSVQFNRFSPYAKFTVMMCGGFDGVNILDKDAARMNDKSTSFDAGGGAASGFISPSLSNNQAGEGTSNSGVISYRTAIDIMTDPLTISHNILAIPGIKEPYITDYALKKTRDLSTAMYILDIPSYDDQNVRLFDDSTSKPDVTNTAKAFDSRGIDNSYAATYFPDVFIADGTKRVRVASSVPALAAYSYNDRVAFPWFAPAGYNRASLDSVKNATTRLNTDDRDALSAVRINSIATFPKEGFTIYDQKTLQIANTALARVNVRRLLIEVKREATDVAKGILWENSSDELKKSFKNQLEARLRPIQGNQGISDLRVIVDASNNTEQDKNSYRLNGKIRIVPIRSVEKIELEFVVTNSGIEFLE